MAIALGGCLKAPPVAYGITEDTGGHIAYVLGACRALAGRADVSGVEIVTRRFDHAALGPEHDRPVEPVAAKLRIVRIDSGDRRYLAKEELARDRPAFTAALIEHLKRREAAGEALPDIIHAHFADAAEVAARVRRRFGIPFVYTAHSLAMDKASALAGARASPAASVHAARVSEEERAIAAADAIVASSRDECERQLPAYRQASAGRIHRLRPGVAAADPPPAALASARALIAPFLRQPDRPMLLAIARPVHKKNLVALVEAFAAEPTLRSRANLVILSGLREGIASCAGEHGAVLVDLVDAIDRHDLHGMVAWPRRHTADDVQALYALARKSGGLFVNPALAEPYGLTLVEAAAHGLPVVATRVGGPQDIVAELRHGTLVDPRSREELGSAMAALLTDRDRWAACSRNALANSGAMTWEVYAAGFMTLARRIVAPAAQSRPAFPARPASAMRRLLLSDIDNTLTGCPAGARRLARHLVRRSQSTIFGVATGRSLVEARRLLLEWNLPDPEVVVASVGTEIWWRDGRDLSLDTHYRDAIAQDWDAGAVEAAVARLAGLEPQPPIEQRCFKRSYFTLDPAVAEEARGALAAAGIAARVVYSHGRLLDILPAKAGKGAAMMHVSVRLGLPFERIVAAGDSGNDADMLAACPGAVVVANHDPDLAAVATLRHVYRARRSHAAGVLEGLLWHARRGRPAELRSGYADAG